MRDDFHFQNVQNLYNCPTSIDWSRPQLAENSENRHAGFIGIGTGTSIISLNQEVNDDGGFKSETTRLGGTKVDQVFHFSLGFIDLCPIGYFGQKEGCQKVGIGYSIGAAVGLRNFKPGSVKRSSESTAEEIKDGEDQAHKPGPSFGYLFGVRIEIR